MSSYVNGGNVANYRTQLNNRPPTPTVPSPTNRGRAVRRLIGALALVMVFPTIIALRALAATHISTTTTSYAATSANVIYDPLNLVFLLLTIPAAILASYQMHEVEFPNQYHGRQSVGAGAASITLLLTVCTLIPMLYVLIGQHKFDDWLATHNIDVQTLDIPNTSGNFYTLDRDHQRVMLHYTSNPDGSWKITFPDPEK